MSLKLLLHVVHQLLGWFEQQERQPTEAGCKFESIDAERKWQFAETFLKLLSKIKVKKKFQFNLIEIQP